MPDVGVGGCGRVRDATAGLRGFSRGERSIELLTEHLGSKSCRTLNTAQGGRHWAQHSRAAWLRGKCTNARVKLRV
jgi:hypothetical protein